MVVIEVPWTGVLMILPPLSRGIRFQPVEKSFPSSNLGKICASVLIITWSSGNRSIGEKSR